MHLNYIVHSSAILHLAGKLSETIGRRFSPPTLSLSSLSEWGGGDKKSEERAREKKKESHGNISHTHTHTHTQHPY